jgi:hypothetical protein
MKKLVSLQEMNLDFRNVDLNTKSQQVLQQIEKNRSVQRNGDNESVIDN